MSNSNQVGPKRLGVLAAAVQELDGLGAVVDDRDTVRELGLLQAVCTSTTSPRLSSTINTSTGFILVPSLYRES